MKKLIQHILKYREQYIFPTAGIFFLWLLIKAVQFLTERAVIDDPGAVVGMAYSVMGLLLVKMVKGFGNLVLDAVEQGTIEGRNVDELLRSQVSQYRTGKQIAARVNNALGAEIKVLTLESRRQDLQWLRGVTNRYNDEIGAQKLRTSISRVGKNADSPFRAAVKDALLLGDKEEARRLVRDQFANLNPEQRKVRMTALIASVRASQPIKAGYGSEAMRQNFLSWAKTNLSPADYWRVKQVDETYRKTAISIGLMKPTQDISDADLDEAMRKIQAR